MQLATDIVKCVQFVANSMKSNKMKNSENSKVDFDLDFFMPYLLNQAAEVTSQAFQAVYKAEYGMTRTQWRVMANLGKRGPMTATEICRLTFIEKTKMSRAVQTLQEKGFLTRMAIAGDRRSEKLSLTANGLIAFRNLGQRAADFDRNLRRRLGPDLAKSLEKTLRALMRS
jgi:DNA-binding MarR family transcriptional regulator